MGTAFLYGNGGGTGGTGASLTVTAPAGATVTVSKDGKTKTKTAGTDGVAVFRGLATGQWTVTITDGEQTSVPKTVTITADYSTEITFFAATIHVTYPAGSTCTATDGMTTLTAPDTSGTWDCVVPNAGTWTVSLDSSFESTVEITQSGEEKTIDKWYLYNLGNQCTAVTGGWTSSGFTSDQAVAPAQYNDNSIVFSGRNSTHVYAATAEPIDLTRFSTLKFYGAVTGVASSSEGRQYGITIRLTKTKSFNYPDMTAQKSLLLGTYDGDNAALSLPDGSYYIVVFAEALNGISGYMDKLALE